MLKTLEEEKEYENSPSSNSHIKWDESTLNENDTLTQNSPYVQNNETLQEESLLNESFEEELSP